MSYCTDDLKSAIFIFKEQETRLADELDFISKTRKKLESELKKRDSP